MKKDFAFKVGDKVSFGGVHGVVTSTKSSNIYKLNVSLPGRQLEFTIDGRYYDWHTEPLLKLIERPKKKIKKQIKYWVNIYLNKVVTYMSPVDAANNKMPRCLASAVSCH